MGELIRRLTTPVLPAEARYRLRQQRIDEEVAREAMRVLNSPAVPVTERRSWVGAGTGGFYEVRETRRGPAPSYSLKPAIAFDGTSLRVAGEDGFEPGLSVRRGGLRPGFAAHEVAAARCRPMTSGECPAEVAEIAAVALGPGRIRRLYFLDEESRELAAIPAAGLSEDILVELAEHAGIVFRVYAFGAVTGTDPDRRCEVLFPRSARRRKERGRRPPGQDWQAPWP